MPRRVTVPPERLARWLAGFAERHGSVALSPDRLHLTGEDGAQAWLAPPFPPVVGDPVEHALRERTVAVLLVRRGGYAVGVFQGTTLAASKVDTHYVQGTTKAGGWSQQRYARRRANQARAAFASGADDAARVLLPWADRLDAVVGGGDRPAVDSVLADPRLAPLAALRVEPLLAVPDPRLKVLQATPDQFRAVTITLDP